MPANAGDMALSPGQEDPTCCGATKPGYHKYWVLEPEPQSLGVDTTQPSALELVLHNKDAAIMRSPCTAAREQRPLATIRQKHVQQQRPSTAKNKEINFKKVKGIISAPWHSQYSLMILEFG